MTDQLGWLYEEEDFEYLRSGTRFAISEPVKDAPKAFDPRDWLQTEQQGQLGSCAGHAATTAAEVCEFIETQGDHIQLARGFAYLMGQRQAGITGDRGCTITGVVKSLKKDGICQEETFPYEPHYENMQSRDFDEALAEASSHKIVNHTELKSYQDCLNFLQAGQGAIIIGIPWTQGLASNKTGVIKDSNSGGKNLGGHAICLCGWVTPDNSDTPWLILANSHGKRWGDNGFAICHPNWINRNTKDRYSEFIGVSDLSHNFNEPRSFDFFEEWMQ